ncbi:hypothetical protein HY498_01100 [Candidatus Woesearchaeota archaeon]|nr:hypothetical protein [Candidatus Woesearchaeota archaeon]
MENKFLNKKFALAIFVVAYILNFLWEYLHYPLYNCKFPLGVCAVVTSFRDALIILGIYFLGVLFFKNNRWILNLTKLKLGLLLVTSFFIAYIIELQGIYFGKWSYNEFMPIIPVLNVGLSPILQMIFLSFITFLIIKFLVRKLNGKRNN